MENARLLSNAPAVDPLRRRYRFLSALVAVGAITLGGAAGAFAGTGPSPAQPKANPVSQPTPTATPDRRASAQQALPTATGPLPTPGALHYTTDIGACKQAGGNEGTCGALLNKNAIAFYFTWSCGGNCAIGGFKLKNASQTAFDPRAVVRLGGSDPMADAIDVATAALFIEQPPQGGWAGRCYVVTAFKQPVRKLVSDGSGGMKPEGPPIGSYEESPPSPKVCVAALTREVALPVLKKRSYTRTYSLLVNSPPKTTDASPQETSFAIGKTTFGQSGFSLANMFHRAGASFDISALGDVTVYRGRFAYDATKNCGPRFYSPAPSNWEAAVWTKAAGSPLPGSWGGSGNTHTMDVTNLVHGWRSPKRLTFFLMESLTEGLDAEQFNTDVGMMDACQEYGDNVRLILDVGLSK